MNIEQKTITSMEVAEMVEKDHKNILRDIKGYLDEMSQLNFEPSDYFTESTYENRGKEYPCYNVSLKGCEFIGHKLIGIKGTEFTVKYINRFHDMEETIKSGLLEGLSPELQAIFAHDKKLQIIVNHMEFTDRFITDVDKDLQDFKQDMPLLGLECDRITSAVKTEGVHCLGGKDSAAYSDKSLRSRVYQDIHHQIKREFGVSTYKAIKRSQTDLAVQKINSYQLPIVLQEEIADTNAQMVL